MHRERSPATRRPKLAIRISRRFRIERKSPALCWAFSFLPAQCYRLPISQGAVTMRILIAAVSLVVLAGCSSIADIRKNPPILTLSSDRSAKDVAECIRDGWQGTPVVGGSIGGILQASGDQYSVIAPGPESPWHVADVTPTATGSMISYRFIRTWQSPTDSVPKTVKACAG